MVQLSQNQPHVSQEDSIPGHKNKKLSPLVDFASHEMTGYTYTVNSAEEVTHGLFAGVSDLHGVSGSL